MKSAKQILFGAMLTAAVMAIAASARAQVQTTGTPGSPGATTTISGKQLPAPDPKFGGVIKNDALQFKYWWALGLSRRSRRPNILLIMTDDRLRHAEQFWRHHPNTYNCILDCYECVTNFLM